MPNHNANPQSAQSDTFSNQAVQPSLSTASIVLLAVVSALGPVAMQILLPALPLLRDDLQVTGGAAQLTLSLSMLSIAVATLVYGPVSDRYGRKPVMIVGLLITILGSLLCIVAPNIELLIIARVIQAAGGAVGLVLARAIVLDVYGSERAASVIATLVMVMVVMPMLSPSVGGELMVLFGWRSVFVVVALVSVMTLVLLPSYVPETLKEAVPFSGVPDMLRGFAALFQSRIFCGYAFAVSFVSVIFFSFIAAAPEIMITVLERPATEYGYYYIMIPAGFIIGNYCSRRYANRFGIHRMIEFGSKLTIAGILLALILHRLGFLHPVFLFAPITVATFGNGLTLPNAQAGAISEFPRHAGAASGLTGFLQMGFAAVAAQVVALIFNGTVYPMLFLMLGAAFASLLSLRWLVGNRVSEAYSPE